MAEKRLCSYCQKPFQAKNARHIYCSRRCGMAEYSGVHCVDLSLYNAAYYQRNRERLRAKHRQYMRDRARRRDAS